METPTASLVMRMMLSEEYCDLTFSCHGELFKVHKAVVCPQSSVIQAAVRPGFQEAQNSTLNMDAFIPESVRRFKQFLYTQDYDSTATGVEPSPPLSKEVEHPELCDPVFQTILAHTRMIAMGDYYDVPPLVALANERIAAVMASSSPDSPWVAGLPTVAEVALSIVDSAGLTDVLTGAISDNLATILAVGTLEESPLVTPFCLALLKRCSAANQALSEDLAYKTRTLNEVGGKYQRAAEGVLEYKKAVHVLSTTIKCRSSSCNGRFDGYFPEGGTRLRCRLCQAKH